MRHTHLKFYKKIFICSAIRNNKFSFVTLLLLRTTWRYLRRRNRFRSILQQDLVTWYSPVSCTKRYINQISRKKLYFFFVVWVNWYNNKSRYSSVLKVLNCISSELSVNGMRNTQMLIHLFSHMVIHFTLFEILPK